MRVLPHADEFREAAVTGGEFNERFSVAIYCFLRNPAAPVEPAIYHPAFRYVDGIHVQFPTLRALEHRFEPIANAASDEDIFR